MRATSRPDHLVENNIETTDSTSSLATVESESAFLGGSTGEASPSLSNILVFWKSSLPRADADTPKWPESRKSGGRWRRPPFLLRLLVAIFRMLPYAVRRSPHSKRLIPTHGFPFPSRELLRQVRNQIGNYRFPESRAKRKQQADKHTRISRHRLETILDMGVRPSRLATYQQALTHPSAVEDRTESFERLELLGDGVLTLVARELLLERLPTANEGMITIQTSALVSNECISSVAQWLGIGRYVRGHCIDANNSRGILCDSFEALVGAVYTDKGLEGARRFITRVLKACPFAELDTMRLDRNFVADLKFAVRNKQSGTYHPFELWK